MSGKRAIQKRSKAESPKARRRRFDFGLGDGRGFALAVSGAASFAGALAGSAGMSPTRRYLDRMFNPPAACKQDIGAVPAGVSCPAVGGVDREAGGFGAAAPACFGICCLKPGATRDFLRARYPGEKPQFLISQHTGVPPDTVRKAMAWRNPSELCGSHLMRLVAVFGPAFLAAVLDPVPVWVRVACEGGGGHV